MIEPKTGEKYRHFNGQDKIYEIVCVALDCENPENKMVIYKQLYETENFPVGTIWKRDLEIFVGFKELNGKKVKRFTKL
ncbi:MAG: DUF1653 domain-containing protein [Nanoarchaeota archaeon]|nr:DUF1653 domain-containing protein [Nanoarchaeota archaeon]